MLYNKERPHNFNQMVGQRHIVENIRNQSKEDKWFQVYILAGQFGGGKTTMARIIALASNCKNKDPDGNPCLECENCKSILRCSTTDVVEIDAASNTGVDSVRELKERTEYKPLNLSKKVYIIDEVHMISKQAFNALLKILEEPPKDTLFIMCTTDLRAIPATVRSRSAIYIFEQISFTDILGKIEDVSKERNYNINRDALVLIAKNAQGSMRNAYSLLQQVTSGSKDEIVADDVQKLLGISDPTYVFELLKNIIDAEPGKCVISLEKAAALGKDMSLMVNDMIDIIANAVIAKSASLELVHETEQYKSLLKDIVDMSYLEQLCHIADGLMDIRVDFRKCPEKTTVTVGIIRITSSSINKSILSRLEHIEKILSGKGKDVLFAKENVVQNCTQSNDVELAEDKAVMENVYYEDGVAEDVDTVTEIEETMNETVKDEVNMDEAEVVDDEAETFIETEEIKEEVEEDGVDNNAFDVFSMLEQFNSISNSSFIPDTSITNSETNEIPAKQRRLEERLRLVSSGDSIFETVIMGCARSMNDGILILETPLKPVYDIICAYLYATDIKEVEVKYNPHVALCC